MSADNWGECPKCKAAAASKEVAEKQKASDLYGKVSPEEYLRLIKEEQADEDESEGALETLREDYEIYIDPEGKFYVGYHAQCECGFTFSFKFSKDVLKEPT